MAWCQPENHGLYSWAQILIDIFQIFEQLPGQFSAKIRTKSFNLDIFSLFFSLSGKILAMLNWIKGLRARIFFWLFYRKTPPWDTGITPPEVMEFIERTPPSRAIDLGCGTGTNLLTLRQHGWEVTGIDFVDKAIRQAKRKARRANLDVNLIVGDVTNPRLFDGKYELILDIGCYHVLHQQQRSAYRENIFNHLAPGGTFILYGWLSDQPDRISPADISAFETRLTLTKRQDSEDPTGPKSSYLWFQAKEG